MKAAALTLAATLTTAVLWLAGEQHRENCIRDGRNSCSVLPWESGEAPRDDTRRPTAAEILRKLEQR